MSTVRTLALGALMLVGVAGVSAAQSTETPRTRPDAGSYQRGNRRGPGGREGFGRDLNLTDAQKAQIKAIRQKYQPQNEALRAQAKPYMEAARAARQKGDTAAFRSNIEKAHQLMQGASFRAQEQAEIRAVLTPEQQAKFDARKKEHDERGEKGGHKGWGRKGHGEKPEAKQ
jgi:Spy/CpxP family protein refolding chaperone